VKYEIEIGLNLWSFFGMGLTNKACGEGFFSMCPGVSTLPKKQVPCNACSAS